MIKSFCPKEILIYVFVFVIQSCVNPLYHNNTHQEHTMRLFGQYFDLELGEFLDSKDSTIEVLAYFSDSELVKYSFIVNKMLVVDSVIKYPSKNITIISRNASSLNQDLRYNYYFLISNKSSLNVYSCSERKILDFRVLCIDTVSGNKIHGVARFVNEGIAKEINSLILLGDLDKIPNLLPVNSHGSPVIHRELELVGDYDDCRFKFMGKRSFTNDSIGYPLVKMKNLPKTSKFIYDFILGYDYINRPSHSDTL